MFSKCQYVHVFEEWSGVLEERRGAVAGFEGVFTVLEKTNNIFPLLTDEAVL